MSTSADTVGDTTVADPTPENPYAGQGPVLLDIGGDVGALVVQMPAGLDGLEVELRPAGATQQEQAARDAGAQHRQVDSHDGHQHDGHQHDGHQHDGHQHDGQAGRHPHGPHHPHVAVVGRPVGDTVVHSLVYPDVVGGEYELYPLPQGPVVMTTVVRGGAVTHARWPDQG